MATSRKAGKRGTSGASDTRAGASSKQSEGLSHAVSESAQQIWLAGVGAFGRAQAEGAKLFETLVREGQTIEQSTREYAGSRTEAMREALEGGVAQARERAAGTWDRLEKLVEQRVQRTLANLGVPARTELDELRQRVDEVTAELRRQRARPPTGKAASGKTPARRPTARKATATKRATSKSAVKKTVPKKAVAKKPTPARAAAPGTRRRKTSPT